MKSHRLVIAIALLSCSALACTGRSSQGGTPTAAAVKTAAAVVTTAAPVQTQNNTGAFSGTNHPPSVDSLTIGVVDATTAGLHPNAADTLKAELKTSDPDGDLVTPVLKWVVNGKEIGNGETVAPGKVKASEMVTLEVTATDSRGASTLRSTTIQIANSAPVFTSVPASLNGYRPVATDPDGDPVTIEVSALPPGFKFEGGTLTFDAAAGKAAEGQTISFTAKDKGGAVATQGIIVKF